MKFPSVELLLPFAELAGSSGTDWLTWTCSDEATAAFRDLAPNDEQCAAIVEAHARGWRGHKIASGWVRRWTTAPADYDQWGTTGTIVGEYSGKPLREVAIDPRYLIAQCDRYCSGAVFRGVQLAGDDTYWLVRESPLQPEVVVDRAGRLVRQSAVVDAVRIAASRLAPYLASKAAPDAGDGSYYVACVTYSGNAGLVRGPWRYRGAAEAAIPAVIADAVMEDSKAGGYAWCVIAAPGDELGHPILGAPADPDAAPPAPVAKIPTRA